MLGALYDRVAESAYSLAILILGQPGAAEEIVASVFEQVRNEADIAHSDVDQLGVTVLSLVRQRAIVRRNANNAASFGTNRERASSEIPKPTSGHREALLSPADGLRLQRSLAQLAAEERTAIEWTFFEGLTQEELADRLDLPIDAVRRHVEHGLHTLTAMTFGNQ
jgi:RNA polymerase sigma-70 factor (ECF subfamily)